MPSGEEWVVIAVVGGGSVIGIVSTIIYGFRLNRRLALYNGLVNVTEGSAAQQSAMDALRGTISPPSNGWSC